MATTCRKLRRDVDTRDVHGHGQGHEEPRSSKHAFKYTPLRDVDEIRLLRIPSRKEHRHSGALKTSINHVYLSDSPLYTAISWMWGPRQDLVDLEIDGRVLPIQVNLERIIQDLQDDSQARSVWIDAICIDQDSVEERNHQVQLMGNIYHNANYVVTCLMAERSKDRKKLAKTAKNVHQAFERFSHTHGNASISTVSRLSSEYQLFFDNRYFTRRWIIQEIIQARSVTLCCEGYQMPMSILENVFGERIQQEISKDLINSRAMQLCRLRQEVDRNSLSLEELLYTHETAECSDFRDQVYALISLSEQAKAQLPVRYDINRTELMLSVIIFSRLYENLSPFHALSFTCFLKQHLRIANSEVRYATLAPPVSTMNTTVMLQGVVRGTVGTHRIGPERETTALRLRDIVPALKTLSRIHLEFSQSSCYDTTPLIIVDRIDRQSSRYSEGNAPIPIPGIDQCLFAFEGDDSRRSTKAYRERPIIAGLASTRVNFGDEIWQFQRTPLAIIARRSEQGYTLVGRAYLLKELSTGCHSDKSESRSLWDRKLEDGLIWVQSAKRHDQLTPIIHIDVCGLLKLMTWATYDA